MGTSSENKLKNLESLSREQLLEHIEQLNLQLSKSSKLAQLGEMAGGIGHEINNPIAIIKGHAEHLQSLVEDGSQDKQLLSHSAATIMKTVDRVAAIVKSMCSLARDGTHDPFVKTNLVTVLNDSLVFFREKFRNQKIEVSIKSPDELVIPCRGVQISQVFINLIGNAFDVISPLRERWIEIEIKEEADEIVTFITDSGKRIPDEQIAKIMQPFFTTKAAGSGTGLGLSISKSIVEQHRGSLHVDPKHPNTRFVLKLPKDLT